jgi:hypothetical protein
VLIKAKEHKKSAGKIGALFHHSKNYLYGKLKLTILITAVVVMAMVITVLVAIIITVVISVTVPVMVTIIFTYHTT